MPKSSPYMRFARDHQRGLSASSYGVAVGTIALVALLAVTGVGSNISSMFGGVSDDLEGSAADGALLGTGPVTANDDTAYIPTGAATSIDVLANDSGNGIAITSVIITSSNSPATASHDGSTITVTSAGVNEITLQYQIENSSNSDTATLTVTVQNGHLVDDIGDTSDGNFTAGNYTLREAIEQASNGDLIQFDTALNGQTITTSGFAINNDLIIDGTGRNITIDGASTARPFTINVAKSLTLDGLTIANGRSSSQGGGLYAGAGANVTLRNCRFEDNRAQGGGSNYGGAVMHFNGTLLIDNCDFAGNAAITSGTHARGGAIGINGNVQVQIFNAGFDGNFAQNNSGTTSGSTQAKGGAISFDGGNNVQITNTVFNNNYTYSTVQAFGGGIWSQSITGGITLTGVTFTNNRAEAHTTGSGSGGAAQFNLNGPSTLSMDSATSFTANEAIGVGSGRFAYGGALTFYNIGNTVNFANQMIGNAVTSSSGATPQGAAMYISGYGAGVMALGSGTQVCSNLLNGSGLDNNQLYLNGMAITPSGADAGVNPASGGIYVAGGC